MHSVRQKKSHLLKNQHKALVFTATLAFYLQSLFLYKSIIRSYIRDKCLQNISLEEKQVASLLWMWENKQQFLHKNMGETINKKEWKGVLKALQVTYLSKSNGFIPGDKIGIFTSKHSTVTTIQLLWNFLWENERGVNAEM